jgi:hypothetical protein
MIYHLGVNFKWGHEDRRSVSITRTDFDELQDLLKKMSNNKFKFHYTTQSLTMDNIDIIQDSKPAPPMGAVERECRLRVLEMKAQGILDEVRCIRNND